MKPEAEQQKNTNNIRRIRSTTFGIYDPETLGISFHNMETMINVVNQDEQKLTNWLMQTENAHLPEKDQHLSVSNFKAQISKGETQLNLTDTEIENFNKMKEEHRKKFEFYYRIRVHEKNHWYTHISSSIPISRLISTHDMSNEIWVTLKKIYPKNFISRFISCFQKFIIKGLKNTKLISDKLILQINRGNNQEIYLPLFNWSKQTSCPKKLSKIIYWYHANRLADMLVDGELLSSEEFSFLSDSFPDLKSYENFWEKTFYQIGYLALIEGAGKAAEWLYALRKDPSIEERAWEDIRKAPPIYRVALERLIDTLPSLTLLEYLQIFSVLVEFSINPFPNDEGWPFIWGTSAPDMLPGFRYQRLLDLLINTSDFDSCSKQSISDFLIKATKKAYDWASPAEVANHMLSLVIQKSRFKIPNSNYQSFWDPRETIKIALTVKAIDPLAYVAPVNAKLINSSNTYPQVEVTSPRETVGSNNATRTYFLMWYQSIIIESLIYNKKSQCPCMENEWFSYIVASVNGCKQNILFSDDELQVEPEVKWVRLFSSN